MLLKYITVATTEHATDLRILIRAQIALVGLQAIDEVIIVDRSLKPQTMQLQFICLHLFRVINGIILLYAGIIITA
ncbi:hypothetical protein D3C87_1311140 [compost metagenome]